MNKSIKLIPYYELTPEDQDKAWKHVHSISPALGQAFGFDIPIADDFNVTNEWLIKAILKIDSEVAGTVHWYKVRSLPSNQLNVFAFGYTDIP